VLAVNPESEVPMLVVEEEVELTLPDAGVVVIHAALGVAVQFNGWVQVPLALIVAGCAA